jgi:hypothetical protein
MEYDEELHDEEVYELIEDYKRKKLLEDMSGPTISLILHLIILSILFVILVKTVTEDTTTVEVTIEEQIIKELKEPIKEITDPDTVEETVEDVIVEETKPDDVKAEDVAPIEDVVLDKPSTDDNMEQMEINVAEHFNSPLRIPLGGGKMSAGARNKEVAKHGGSKKGQDAVNKGLRWLARVQNDDGSWGTRKQHGRTGMALLCFLAHGETPLSPEYGQTVQKALQWIAKEADKGVMGSKRGYEHGIATFALAEGFGMTQIPALRSPLDKAIKVIIDGQQDGGGFDYNYRKGLRVDMSVSGWNIQALKAARIAGLDNKDIPTAIKKAVKYLKNSHHSKDGYSSFDYVPNMQKPTMTGIGTVSLQLLGQHNSPEALGGVTKITQQRLPLYTDLLKNPDKWNSVAAKQLYSFYYDTIAMFNAGGQQWKDWLKVYEPVLIRAQHTEGFWQSNKHHGQGTDLDGRILTTCFALQQLEVFYKFLPTFDMTKVKKHAVLNLDADVNGVIEFE